ncbi:MAG: hypothetical protein ABI895_17395 [Deltaproteobacteria bacterium]
MSSAGSSGRPSGAGSSLEQLLSPRRTQVLLLATLAVAFVAFRWLQRLEPWNSDDMDLFQLSIDAAAGRHWLFESVPGLRLSHHAFRIGLFLVTIPAIKALGASATAYYLVPLLFSLLGFGALYWLVLSHFGALVALAVAIIHIAWPFELEHASVLLTDLPAAAMALVCLCLLEASARQTRGQRILCVLLAGSAACESQLLRNNALVLLAPALLVFVWSRPTRVPTLWAGAVTALGLLAQQALLVQRGLGWGSDWSSVALDLADYSRFLPIHSWPAFLVRQFAYQLTTFGRGLGILAALLVAGSLAGHVLLLRYERRRLLVSVAIFGLLTWLVYSFSIYERVPGGVRAMAPVNYRYIQPFAYSSLVVWAWLWCKLHQRLAARRAAAPRPGTRARTELPLWLASAALPLLLLTFSYAASAFHLSTYRSGGTRRLVDAIAEQLAHSDTALVIAGAGISLQVPRMFCCASGARRVEWRALEPAELGTLGVNATTLLLRDIPRELELARYLDPPERQSYRAELGRLEERLWRDAELAYVDRKYALFAAPRAGVSPSADLARDAQTTPSLAPPGAPLLDAAPCGTSAQDVERTLVPLRTGRRRTPCAYTWLSDGLVTSRLVPPSAAGAGLVLRLDADFEPPVSLSVELVEASAGGLRRERTTLSPGASYLPVPLRAGLDAVFVVYRVTTRGGLDARTVRLRPARWRLQQSLASVDDGFRAGSAGAAAP